MSSPAPIHSLKSTPPTLISSKLNHLVLAVTVIALACLTLGALAYFKQIPGLNFHTSIGLFSIGGGLAILGIALFLRNNCCDNKIPAVVISVPVERPTSVLQSASLKPTAPGTVTSECDPKESSTPNRSPHSSLTTTHYTTYEKSASKSTKMDASKLRKALSDKQFTTEHIDLIVAIIQEITSQATYFGQPIAYDREGMAYLRKNDRFPVTLQIHQSGDVYIHFKSKSKHQQDLLGSACQKAVYRALNQAGELVAASVIHERFEQNNTATFEVEKTALELFQGCPYVIQSFHANQYLGKKLEQMKYGLILEYCDGSAGSDFLNRMSLKDRWMFFLNVMQGTRAMHTKGWCHFDLKSDNILYKQTDAGYEPRIIDFGVMHVIGETLTSGARGAYLPPEYMIHENYPIVVSEKVDVWALGIYAIAHLMHVDLDCRYDLITDTQGRYAGKKAVVKIDWSKSSPDNKVFIPIIAKMLAANPEERISLKNALDLIQQAIHNL